jgi:hypothetical protein
MKEWYSPNGECHYGTLNGQRIKVNESWQLSDGSVVNYPGDLYGGIKNCRCIEVIVI